MTQAMVLQPHRSWDRLRCFVGHRDERLQVRACSRSDEAWACPVSHHQQQQQLIAVLLVVPTQPGSLSR